MKFTIILISALLSITQVIATAIPNEVDVDIAARDDDTEAAVRVNCNNRRLAVPFFRAFNEKIVDHFYTTNRGELQNAIRKLGYKAEGITGRLYTRKQLGTVPFYRLYSQRATDHFYTASIRERDNAISRLGYKSEGIAGWFYTTPVCGTRPLYRLFSANGTDHFYTLSRSERDVASRNGYREEGISGFIFPPT